MEFFDLESIFVWKHFRTLRYVKINDGNSMSGYMFCKLLRAVRAVLCVLRLMMVTPYLECSVTFD